MALKNEEVIFNYLGTMMKENCRYFDIEFENTKDDMSVHIEDGLESK